MKKGIVFSLLLLFSISVCFSQKLNNEGRKMVSEVVFVKYEPDGSISDKRIVEYRYDEKLNIKAVVLKCGNDVTVLDKNVGNKQKNIFEYKFKSGLLVSKCLKYTIFKDSLKDLTTYHYSVKDGKTVLSQIMRQTFAKDGKKWVESNDAYYLNFEYKDGDYYWGKMWSSRFKVENYVKFYGGKIQYDKIRYSNIKNDLNINPNTLIPVSCWAICLDVHEFELSTSWCGLESEHIIEYSDGKCFEIIVNDKGNITEIINRYKDGGILADVTIKYVY